MSRSRRTASAVVLAAALLAGVVALGAGGTAQQQPSPMPTFMPGPAEIVGEVSIVNEPAVHAQQLGPWVVTLANDPVVSADPPEFVTAGRTYAIEWPGDAGVRTYRVISPGRNGWVRAEPVDADGTSHRPRWINTAMAIEISE